MALTLRPTRTEELAIKTMSKKAYHLGAALTLAMLVSALPVTADAPTRVEFGPFVFVDIDPCTGTPHEIAIFVEAYEHRDHNNNFVATVVRTGFTDSGYELFSGNEVTQFNRNAVMSRFKDSWRNDDGRMMEVSGKFILNFNRGEVKLERFTFRCIGAETILP